MAEHSPAKKRRIKIPEIEREYWRRAFFDDVHGRRRVQNLIEQDLRPLWRNVGSDVPIPETAAQWDAYLEAAKSGTLPVPPSHVAFSSRLDEIVRDTLRCRINGAPADWMYDYLARAVAEQLPDGPDYWPGVLAPNGDPISLLDINVRVGVGPYGVWLDSRGFENIEDGRRFFMPPEDEDIYDRTGRWDDWDLLTRRAHAILDDGLRKMRSYYEALNPQQLNIAADDRQRDDVTALAAYLVDRMPLSPDRAQRERLRRFANLVGLDFPVADS